MLSRETAGVGFGVAERDVAVEVDLLVIPDELEDRDVEAAGERHAVLRHADGVVLDVRTPAEGQRDGVAQHMLTMRMSWFSSAPSTKTPTKRVSRVLSTTSPSLYGFRYDEFL
ncbi:hypothetical protein EYF80_042447 [Liparis tanakae]|uniref:Uncharacterized protein n=1 Tax=Liparis tanakae TaxID=230148 RepID=A0A4Z2G1G2_9TELE|nr:hypothetical protein EYF80_042447 [Liparis tanakae]